MAGVQIEVTGSPAVRQKLADLLRRAGGTGQMMDLLGGLVESQTRRRLSQDKEGPEGEAWPDWSPAYAETRRSNHHLLENEGTLIDSIHYMVEGGRVEVGSGMVYAAIHQFGGAEAGMPQIPARPYLGVSHDDASEIEETLGHWLGGALA